MLKRDKMCEICEDMELLKTIAREYLEEEKNGTNT